MICNFFTNKQKQEEMEQKRVDVVLTSYSQGHVLQQRMKEADLTHGDPVRLESNYGKMVMYFCPMYGVNIHERLEKGDYGSLPQDAIVEGISVPGNMKPGLYELKNVQLFSNGTLQVIATADTAFVAV
jgi:hypothetical protein